MLTIVKLGAMPAIAEKTINRALNNWCRMPAIVMWMAFAHNNYSAGLLRGPMPPIATALQASPRVTRHCARGSARHAPLTHADQRPGDPARALHSSC